MLGNNTDKLQRRPDKNTLVAFGLAPDTIFPRLRVSNHSEDVLRLCSAYGGHRRRVWRRDSPDYQREPALMGGKRTGTQVLVLRVMTFDRPTSSNLENRLLCVSIQGANVYPLTRRAVTAAESFGNCSGYLCSGRSALL